MAENYLQIRKLVFRGQNKESVLSFSEGVNSICGASDTGKSFIAEFLISCWEERSYGNCRTIHLHGD